MDYRVPLSLAEFDAIPVDDEHPISEYYDKLIANNVKFRDVEGEYPRGYGDIRVIPRFTRGQQLLILLGYFDGQVKNGGITQFFWNRAEYIFAVRDAMAELGASDLLHNYEEAVEALGANRDRWLALREECYKEGKAPDWEPFRQSYALLDLGWFDTAYFDKWGYNDSKEWVFQRRGLHHGLLTRLVEYVRSHREDFISPE